MTTPVLPSPAKATRARHEVELDALKGLALLRMDPNNERGLTFWQELARPRELHELLDRKTNQFAMAVFKAAGDMSPFPWDSQEPFDGDQGGSFQSQAVRQLQDLQATAERALVWLDSCAGQSWQQVVEWGSHSGHFLHYPHLRMRDGSEATVQDLNLPLGKRFPDWRDALETVARHSATMAKVQKLELNMRARGPWYGPNGAGPKLHVAHMLRYEASEPWPIPEIAVWLGISEPKPGKGEPKAAWQERRSAEAKALGRRLRTMHNQLKSRPKAGPEAPENR